MGSREGEKVVRRSSEGNDSPRRFSLKLHEELKKEAGSPGRGPDQDRQDKSGEQGGANCSPHQQAKKEAGPSHWETLLHHHNRLEWEENPKLQKKEKDRPVRENAWTTYWGTVPGWSA